MFRGKSVVTPGLVTVLCESLSGFIDYGDCFRSRQTTAQNLHEESLFVFEPYKSQVIQAVLSDAAN